MTNDCESAIAKTGWGLCHNFIIGLCGMCTLAEASASLIVLIVAPLLACDLNLNASQATTLNAISTFGMAMGAFLFGTIADTNGRKGSIPITMAIVFCSSVMLSFAQTSFLINLSLFVLGLGLAGNNTVLRVYLIECLPVKQRGSCLVILDLLWIVGYLSALGISWLLVPLVIQIQSKNFRPYSWRVLAGLGSTPNLVMACVISLLPPSPRYLLYRRRTEEALSVLQQIYAINSSKHTDTYPLSDLDNCIRPDEEDEEDTRMYIRIVQKCCRKLCKRIRKLFETPLRLRILLGMLICILQLPGFIWLALWNTSVLNEMEAKRISKLPGSNSTCIVSVENLALGFLHNCEKVDSNRFEFLLLLSLSYVVGEVLLFAGVDTLGRKTYLVSSGIFGATASLMLIFVTHHTMRIVLSSIFLTAYAVARTATTILLLENYPTALRGTMMGVTRILPYAIAASTKLSSNLYCLPSIIAASGFLLGTTIAALPLPDLTGAPMQE